MVTILYHILFGLSFQTDFDRLSEALKLSRFILFVKVIDGGVRLDGQRCYWSFLLWTGKKIIGQAMCDGNNAA
jgi:hypothetical protein